jgi:hypothetical protein
MPILVIVGIGVVVLGAFVLLLFPDRPGGKIAWQGVEASSIGAGLPLIVVGIAAIAVSGGRVLGGDGGGGAERAAAVAGTQTAVAMRCPDDLSAGLPAGRVADVESGANAQIVAGPTASKTEPFGLHFTDGGRTIGAMRARFFPASGVFRIESFVDARCRPVHLESLQPGVGALTAAPNYADVRVDLLGRSYVLNLGGGADIRTNFAPFTP